MASSNRASCKERIASELLAKLGIFAFHLGQSDASASTATQCSALYSCAPESAGRLSAMLERYCLRPATLDRLRSSWLGEPLERYVSWLSEHGYAARNVFHCVPLVMQFGTFAKAHGAHRRSPTCLPTWTDFVESWIDRRDRRRQVEPTRRAVQGDPWPGRAVPPRGPPGFQGTGSVASASTDAVSHHHGDVLRVLARQARVARRHDRALPVPPRRPCRLSHSAESGSNPRIGGSDHRVECSQALQRYDGEAGHSILDEALKQRVPTPASARENG